MIGRGTRRDQAAEAHLGLIQFASATTGLRIGALLIGDSDPSSPQTVGVSGTGTSKVSLKPTSVVSPTQAIGTTTPTASEMKVTLTSKTGTMLTLGNPAVSVSGPFAAVYASTCTNGLPIAANGTCSIFLTFTPTVVGYVTGTLSIGDTDASSPQTVALSGTGTGVEFTPQGRKLAPCIPYLP